MVNLLQCVTAALMSREVATTCTIPTDVTNAAANACTGEAGLDIADTVVCTGACAAGFVAAPTSVTCATANLPAFTCPAVGTCPADGLCTAARPVASSPTTCASTTCTIDECCDAAPVCAAGACTATSETAFPTQQVCANPSCTTAECCYTPGNCPADGLCTAARPVASSPTTCASTTCTMDECCDARVHSEPMSTEAWDYSNTAWTIGSCASSTANQSPIDIQTAATVQGSMMAPPSAFSFDPQGEPDSATTPGIQSGLVINAHTVEVEWDSPNTNATDEYGLVIGDRVYKLAQFHYHSPSEHLVNGQHFDMEAHHVHFCDGPSCLTPDIHDDEILVVAVFLSVGTAANVYLQSFWGNFVAGSEPEIENLANPYTTFLPTDKSYYSYTGSTTTPPCATNVQWILMENSVEMSAAQLTAYHTIVNTLPQPFAPAVPPVGVTAPWIAATKCNNRPPQELGTRTVGHFTQPVLTTDPEDPLHPSTIWGFPWWQLLVALAALALLVAGVCFFLNQKSDKPKATRAVKPKAPKAAPKEETVPLMPAPQLMVAPNLSVVVQPQPLMMQQVPQAYTTMARPMAPYGQSPYGP